MEENELQQVLDNILDDKTTNLKPENLRQGITCLGIEGTIEQPEPIYATTDYTIKSVNSSIAGESVNNISVKGNYCLVSKRTSTNLELYKVTNSSLELLQTITSPYSGIASIVKIEDNVIYIVQVSNKRLLIGSYTIDSAQWKTVLNKSTSSTQNIIMNYYNTDYVITYNDGQNDDIGYIYKLNDDNTDVVLVSTTPRISFSLDYYSISKPLAPNIFAAWNIRNTTSRMCLAKCDIETDTWNQQYKEYEIDGNLIGVSYDGTKAFILEKGIYTLNSNLSIGEKLADLTIDIPSTHFLSAINDKYYILANYSNINTGTNNVSCDLYEFNDETNTFTYINSLQDVVFHPGHIASLSADTSLVDIYDFISGDTQIGMSFDGKNYYYSNSNSVTSDKVISGYQVYTKGYQPMIGTMPNNGDVVITPTTQEQTKDKGYYNSLKVSGVTSDIDSNIVPENIKKDISILGVTGTLEETTGTDTSDATAVASDIAINKTAYVNGEKVTGTLPIESNVFAKKAYNSQDEKQYNQIRFFANNDVKTIVDKNIMVQVYTDYAELAETLELTPNKLVKGNAILEVVGTAIELKGQTKTVTPTTNLQTIIPDENYNGLTSVEVSAVTSDIDENIKAENIKSGVEILGVTGTLESGTGVDTSDATATADDIVSPKTAYVNGEKVEGTIKLIDVQDPNSYYGIGDEPTVFMDDNSITFYDRIPVRHCYEQNSFVGVGMSFGEFNNQVGITPDKIVEGNTILGIVGTGGAGTEYEPLSRLSSAVTDVQLLENNFVSLSGVVSDTGIVTENETTFVAGTSFENLANTIGLTADKIKKGETILGITGTYEGTTTTEE